MIGARSGQNAEMNVRSRRGDGPNRAAHTASNEERKRKKISGWRVKLDLFCGCKENFSKIPFFLESFMYFCKVKLYEVRLRLGINRSALS